jgi:hypothetical protein
MRTISNPDAAADSWTLGLPEHVIATLASAGISSIQRWRETCEERAGIFGISPRTAALLDAAVRGLAT